MYKNFLSVPWLESSALLMWRSEVHVSWSSAHIPIEYKCLDNSKAFAFWKEAENPKTKPEFSIRDQDLRFEAPTRTDAVLNRFLCKKFKCPYTKKSQDIQQNRMKNIYNVHGIKGHIVPRMNITIEQHLEMIGKYVKREWSL